MFRQVTGINIMNQLVKFGDMLLHAICVVVGGLHYIDSVVFEEQKYS